MNSVIITDSCCDLPLSFIKEHHLPVIGLTITMNGQEYVDDMGETLSSHDFYDAVRGGAMPTTSQINTQQFIDTFKGYLEKGQDVIYIAFSSALSGTCNSAVIAKETLKEEYPERKVTVIDSLSASMGQGLLVYYAILMKEKGHSDEEIIDWLENHKLELNHWFTVDDLNHLKRGGRVSSTAAFIGTILDIKPVLYVNNEGRLIPSEKVKGRKKSIRMLADLLCKRIVNPEEQSVFISHADCLEDAQYLEKLINERVQVKEIVINPIGVVIGSHTGPGAIAVFFMGKER